MNIASASYLSIVSLCYPHDLMAAATCGFCLVHSRRFVDSHWVIQCHTLYISWFWLTRQISVQRFCIQTEEMKRVGDMIFRPVGCFKLPEGQFTHSSWRLKNQSWNVSSLSLPDKELPQPTYRFQCVLQQPGLGISGQFHVSSLRLWLCPWHCRC